MYFITFNGQPARYTSIWVNPQGAAATAQPIHTTLIDAQLFSTATQITV